MSKISTRDLTDLPDIDQLKLLLQSLATLDAIMSPDWDGRYFSFNANWSSQRQLGSMRNGSGDEFFALFQPTGCCIKGFAHESSMTPYRVQPPQVWPGILDELPEEFSSAMQDPALAIEEATFCIWRRYADSSWLCGSIQFPPGEDPDGSAGLLALLDGHPASYCDYAEEIYETTIPEESVRHVYNHVPLTENLLSSLTTEVRLKGLAKELAEIGYPVRAGH